MMIESPWTSRNPSVCEGKEDGTRATIAKAMINWEEWKHTKVCAQPLNPRREPECRTM